MTIKNSNGFEYELELEVGSGGGPIVSIALYEKKTDTYCTLLNPLNDLGNYLFDPFMSGQNQIEVHVTKSWSKRKWVVTFLERIPTKIEEQTFDF